MKNLFSLFTFLIFCLLVPLANSADLTSGLVGHWPLDGNAKAEVKGVLSKTCILRDSSVPSLRSGLRMTVRMSF
jgi:hypothetical protein